MPSVQLLSVPAHAYDLKVRKIYRTQLALSGAALSTNFTIQDAMDAIREEMNVTVGTGEAFSIHGVRVYAQTASTTAATNAALAPVQLAVTVHDIEENVTGNSVSQFVDESAVSGVAAVRWLYPVNNRPTWNRGITPTTTVLFNIDVTASINSPVVPITIDLDVDYTRVNTTPLTQRRRIIIDGVCQPRSSVPGQGLSEPVAGVFSTSEVEDTPPVYYD